MTTRKLSRYLLSLSLSLSLSATPSAFAQEEEFVPGPIRLGKTVRFNPYKSAASFRERFSYAGLRYAPSGNRLFVESALFDQFDLSTSTDCEDDGEQNCPNRSVRVFPEAEVLEGFPVNIFGFPMRGASGLLRLPGVQLNVLNPTPSPTPLPSPLPVPQPVRQLGRIAIGAQSQAFRLPRCRRVLDDSVEIDGSPTIGFSNPCTTLLEAWPPNGGRGLLTSNATGLEGVPEIGIDNNLQLPLLAYGGFSAGQLRQYVDLTSADNGNFSLLGEVIEVRTTEANELTEVAIEFWQPEFTQTSFSEVDGSVQKVLAVFSVSSRISDPDSSFAFTAAPLGSIMILFDVSSLPSYSAQIIRKENGRPYRLADKHAFLSSDGSKILFREENPLDGGRDEMKILTCSGLTCEESLVDPVPQLPDGKDYLILANASRDFSKILTVSSRVSGFDGALATALIPYEKRGLAGVEREVEVHFLNEDGTAYDAPVVVSNFPSGERIPACFERCLERNSLETDEALARRCLFNVCLNLSTATGFPRSIETLTGDTFLTNPLDIEFTFLTLSTLFSPIGPRSYGARNRTDSGEQSTIVTYLMDPQEGNYGDGFIVPDRGANLFASIITEDRDVSTTLITTREKGRALNDHRRSLYLPSSIDPDGKRIAFLSSGQVGRFSGTPAGQIYIARVKREPVKAFKEKLQDAVEDLEEVIEEEDSRPIIELPPEETPKARTELEIPTSFVEELYDSILEQELDLKRRTERRLEQLLGLIDSLSIVPEIQASNKKKKKKKTRKADVVFKVRVERSVGIDAEGNTIWKRVKKGVSRTKSIAKFKLPKLKSGTYRAFYRVQIKRSGKKRGQTTELSQPTDFTIER